MKQKIEEKLGKKFTFHHARFSNNNNPDGQTLHRDIKPYYFFNNTFPKIYTTVFYLDKSIFYLGNKTFYIKPGDVLIFNSLSLHAAGDISFLKKIEEYYNGSILSLIKKKKKFYENHSFCEHYSNEIFSKYISHFIDARYIVEMANLTHFFTTQCSNKKKTLTLISMKTIIFEMSMVLDTTKIFNLINNLKNYFDITFVQISK